MCFRCYMKFLWVPCLFCVSYFGSVYLVYCLISFEVVINEQIYSRIESMRTI